ncbi:unnamed protein product [Rotaria sordida]|uniref:Uncharacterized protein n=1 Tax=Rotaria sordida TaxID=392033 RepID=A0A815UA36_9BILA|nr:unnamed protein product [Rotaria sordida]
MSMNDGEVHLLPLIDNNDFDNSSSESEDDDSIEVVSNVDEEENKIIDMTKYLTFSSDDESEIDDNANDITLLDNHIIHCSNINDRTQSSAPDGTCLGVYGVFDFKLNFGKKNDTPFRENRGSCGSLQLS